MMKAFQCRTCGDCCYGVGGIFVEEQEIESISRFLNISQEVFLARFCEEKHGRFYVKTGSDNFCIFYHKEKGCTIHPVKPNICSLWPFYPAIVNDEENWEMAKEACPGINSECSFEHFVRQSKRCNSSGIFRQDNFPHPVDLLY